MHIVSKLCDSDNGSSWEVPTKLFHIHRSLTMEFPLILTVCIVLLLKCLFVCLSVCLSVSLSVFYQPSVEVLEDACSVQQTSQATSETIETLKCNNWVNALDLIEY